MAKKRTKTYRGKIRPDMVRWFKQLATDTQQINFYECAQAAEHCRIELPDDSDEAERRFEADFDVSLQWWLDQINNIEVPK